jgi:hypothetical protein
MKMMIMKGIMARNTKVGEKVSLRMQRYRIAQISGQTRPIISERYCFAYQIAYL